jgi:hypothetical protein
VNLGSTAVVRQPFLTKPAFVSFRGFGRNRNVVLQTKHFSVSEGCKNVPFSNKNRFAGPAGGLVLSRNLRPGPKFSPLRLFIIFLSGRQGQTRERAQEDGRKVQQQLPVAKSCQTPPTHTTQRVPLEKSAAPKISIYQPRIKVKAFSGHRRIDKSGLTSLSARATRC